MSTITFSPLTLEAGLREVTVLLDASSPVTLANGGWAILSRPKDTGFLSWEGFTPESMTVALMFDGVSSNTSQQGDYDALVRLMRTRVGSEKQPSPLRLKGPTVQNDLNKLWVIQSIEQDATGVVRSSAGVLLRVPVVVSLVEYVEADVLISVVPSPAKRLNKNNPAPAPSRTHTIQYGDTLSGIAAKYLGSWKRYTEIAELNGIRDPNRVPVGTVLKIP